jgi:hypothetical protein
MRTKTQHSIQVPTIYFASLALFSLVDPASQFYFLFLFAFSFFLCEEEDDEGCGTPG